MYLQDEDKDNSRAFGFAVMLIGLVLVAIMVTAMFTTHRSPYATRQSPASLEGGLHRLHEGADRTVNRLFGESM